MQSTGLSGQSDPNHDIYRIQNLPTKPLVLVLMVKYPFCLLIHVKGRIPNILNKTFYATAKENEALGVTSERGLTSHEVFMRIMWLPLTCFSLCPTCCWKEREIENGTIPLAILPSPCCCVLQQSPARWQEKGCSSSLCVTDPKKKVSVGSLIFLNMWVHKVGDGLSGLWLYSLL